MSRKIATTGVFLLAAAAMLMTAWQPIGRGPATTDRGDQAMSSVGGVHSAAILQPARELRVGDPAPDFTLPDQNRQDVTLSQFRGQTVQLAFYVWAFSPG